MRIYFISRPSKFVLLLEVIKSFLLNIRLTSIIVGYAYREAEMREVSEKTNSRVAWYSIMSLGVCIVVSGLQVWHLKQFFQKKKLI